MYLLKRSTRKYLSQNKNKRGKTENRRNETKNLHVMSLTIDEIRPLPLSGVAGEPARLSDLGFTQQI